MSGNEYDLCRDEEEYITFFKKVVPFLEPSEIYNAIQNYGKDLTPSFEFFMFMCRFVRCISYALFLTQDKKMQLYILDNISFFDSTGTDIYEELIELTELQEIKDLLQSKKDQIEKDDEEDEV